METRSVVAGFSSLVAATKTVEEFPQTFFLSLSNSSPLSTTLQSGSSLLRIYKSWKSANQQSQQARKLGRCDSLLRNFKLSMND